MIDSFGRNIEYMRISLTDSCNLQCAYCTGGGYGRRYHYLEQEKVLQIVKSALQLGITEFRLTGGEPLLYPGLLSLIAAMKAIPEVRAVRLTTNGVLLQEMAKDLQSAGLDGVNVSLDTLDEKEFAKLTGKTALRAVKAGIEEAVNLRLPVKINTVLRQETDIKTMVEYASEMRIPIRFIEMMPIGMGYSFRCVSGEKVLEVLSELYGQPVLLKAVGALNTSGGTICAECEKAEKFTPQGNGPAEYYRIPELQCPVGLIRAVHGKFCANCNRIRVTAEGKLRACLGHSEAVDLTPYLITDRAEKLTAVMRKAIQAKPAGHQFAEFTIEKYNPWDSMDTIGG